MSTGFKITMAVILVAVAAFAYAVWQQPATVTIDMNEVAQSERQEAMDAAQKLFSACPELVAYRSDIEWFKARTDETRDIWVESEHGWKQWVSFEAKVAEDARTPKDWRAWGHHLFYAVGPTGVAVAKDTAGHFCGLGNNSGFVTLQ